MKKIISFVLICLYALGLIGGVGYTLWCGAYLIDRCCCIGMDSMAEGGGVLEKAYWLKVKD